MSTPSLLSPAELDRLRTHIHDHAQPSTLIDRSDGITLLSHIDALQSQLDTARTAIAMQAGMPPEQSTRMTLGQLVISRFVSIETYNELADRLSTIQAAAEAGMPVLERYDCLTDHSGGDSDRHVTPDGEHTNANVAIAHLRNARQASVLAMEMVSLAHADLAAAKVEIATLRDALAPFVPLADQIDAWRHAEDSTCEHRIHARVLRGARAALSPVAQPSTQSPASTTSPSP